MEENESSPSKRRKTSNHISKALRNLNENVSTTTNNSILDQILTPNDKDKNEKQSVNINIDVEDKEEDIDLNGWVDKTVQNNPESIISNTLKNMVKKIDRLSNSKAINDENMLAMIHAGK